jgi:Icc-related predicted phosphoesterase
MPRSARWWAPSGGGRGARGRDKQSAGAGKARRKPKKNRALRIFFATDVHGSDVCFRKFLAAAKVYEADVVLLGGDFAGKGLVPVLRDGGELRAEIDGKEVSVPADGWDQLAADINRRGFYAAQMEPGELGELRNDAAALDRKFRSEIAAQAERWCRLAAERLDPRVRCIITPGNDDPVDADPVYAADDRVEFPSGAVCDLGPVAMASLGVVPFTPWSTERECSEEDLAKLIAEMVESLPEGRECILNFHCPPYATGLDDAPELDTTLKPVIRGGRPSIVPVGSRAVRDAIKKYQPPVSLHGHIHESRGVQRLGRTLCVNPGSDYSSGVLRGAVVDIAEDGTCLDFLLTTG